MKVEIKSRGRGTEKKRERGTEKCRDRALDKARDRGGNKDEVESGKRKNRKDVIIDVFVLGEIPCSWRGDNVFVDG